VYHYFKELYHQTHKMVKTKGDTAGSGIKPRPQKKSGRARQGNKRSPHLWKGGKAHGAKPMDYSFPMNEK
jgi:large subunit ribosomal protein L4